MENGIYNVFRNLRSCKLTDYFRIFRYDVVADTKHIALFSEGSPSKIRIAVA